MTVVTTFAPNNNAGALVVLSSGSSGGGSGGGSTPVNSSGVTRLEPLNLQLGGVFKGASIVPILLKYTTPNTDITISSPPSGQRVYLVGCQGVSNLASNQKFKSSNVVETFQLAANSGLGFGASPNNPDIIFVTNPGESLVFNCDVALAEMMFFIIEV